VDAWVVPDGFFSKGEEMILSRRDSARLGYRLVSEEEDSVDDGEDVLPSEWVPGPILTPAEVPAQVRREVERFPVADPSEPTYSGICLGWRDAWRAQPCSTSVDG
jgi:hypothetical protein